MRRRLSWDECWSQVAIVIGQRSACVRNQVGAVIVSDLNRVVSSGYNGPPAGLASEKALGQTAICEHDCPRAFAEKVGTDYGVCIAIHAEANALLYADRLHVVGGSLYCTHVPCPDCLKLISNSGIVRVVCRDDHAEHRTAGDAWQFLQRCGIELLVMP